MEIRRVNHSDFDAVRALHNEALDAIAAHGGNGPWDDDVRDPLATYVDAGGDFLVAIASAMVVGMVGVQPGTDRTFEIKRMRVSPAHQRKGIGAALLREAERVAAQLGATTLVLDTTTLQVAARSLYERHGYREIRRSGSAIRAHPLSEETLTSAKERTLTSTGVTPLAPQGLSVTGADLEQLLAAEARSLLMAAASGIPVEPERMRAFARACLEVSEVGRLALAVLDGGVFAPRRGLELAEVVSDVLMSAPAAKPSET